MLLDNGAETRGEKGWNPFNRLFGSKLQRIHDAEALKDCLKVSRGTDINELLGENAYLALGFLQKMLPQMSGSEELPAQVLESHPVKVKKRLFLPDEVLRESIDMQQRMRGYYIGATEVGTEPDGEDERGQYNRNFGPGVYLCQDARARSSVRERFVDASFDEGCFPFDSDIYSDVGARADFQTGQVRTDQQSGENRFYPLPLENVLGNIAAANL